MESKPNHMDHCLTFSAWQQLGIALATLLLGLPAALAQSVPDRLNYQGILLKGDGAPVPAVPTTVEFRIWDQFENGSLKWGRNHSVTPDTNGAFSVVLMDGGSPIAGAEFTSLTSVFGGGSQERYLELTVQGSTAIKPRQRFVTTPYAFLAQNVVEARQNFTVTGTLSVNGAANVQALNSSGPVSVRNTLTATTNVNLGGVLTVSNNATIIGQLSTATNANIGGQLTVTNNALIRGQLTVNSSASIGGQLTVTNNAAIGGQLTVTNNATIGGQLKVTGNAALGGQLAVTNGNVNMLSSSGYSAALVERTVDFNSGALTNLVATRTFATDGFVVVSWQSILGKIKENWVYGHYCRITIDGKPFTHQRYKIMTGGDNGHEENTSSQDTFTLPVPKNSSVRVDAWLEANNGSVKATVYFIPFGKQ
jgi:carbonic anhydrase/acetyltransferase-like protein (isoleucine patch superfamily)